MNTRPLNPIRNPQSAIRNATLLAAALSIGCWDNTPPPPRVPVPAPQSYQREADPVRPLAQSVAQDPTLGLPYQDEPLVSQRPPEQQRFVQLYNQVGRPRLVLFVNRTLEGDTIPAQNADPLVSVQSTGRVSGPITVERRDPNLPYDATRERTSTSGPVDYNHRTDVFLKPGEYDEINARSLDYQAVENIMTDWLASSGQVVVTSPTLARQRLSDETIKEMQAGRPQVLAELAQQLNADIFIQVAARPTRQTTQGLEVRLVAEAMNIKGGQSIGRAVVDVPPPLEKTQINKYTRFLARKLMDDMTQTWSAPPPPDQLRPEGSTPASPTTPAPTTPSAPTPPTAAPTQPAAPAAPQPPPVQVTPPPAPQP
jgi:hypothetical protein